MEALTIYTIGHSTRPLADFIALLKTHGVLQLADVRTVPRSRHNPQYNRDTLPAALDAVGIAYVHLAGLGGLRKPLPDSINAAWRNDSFRGFADYMQTEAFAQALAELLELARPLPTAIMCAEAVPWRCHRSLIADALTARGVRVEDILSLKPGSAHKMTPFAHVDGIQVTYPAET